MLAIIVVVASISAVSNQPQATHPPLLAEPCFHLCLWVLSNNPIFFQHGV